jgi:transposase
MPQVSKMLTDGLINSVMEEVKRIGKKGQQAIKLQAIICAWRMGIGEAATAYGVSTNTIRAWIRSFKSGGSEDLVCKPGRGRKSKLDKDSCGILADWTKENNTITIKEMVIRLRQEYGIETSKSAVHRALHGSNLSYITPRPSHYKKDPNLEEEFKKKPKL